MLGGRSRLQPSLWPALGGRGRGAGSDPLRISLLAFGRLGLQPGLGLAQPVFLLVGLGGFSEKISATSYSSLSRVRLALSAALPASLVTSSARIPTRTRPTAAHSFKECTRNPGQGLLVADAKNARWSHGQGSGCRPAPGRPGPRCSAARSAETSAPPGSRHTAAPQQQLGVVGGMAVPVITMRPVERREVELVDDVQDDPGRWPPGSQSRRSGGSRKGWSRSTPKKL
jgi:hypothetical protein